MNASMSPQLARGTVANRKSPPLPARDGGALLDRETELKLARRWIRHRDQEAANRLVEANVRFVAKLANHYRDLGVDHADLVSEGIIGLFEALRYFDPERRNRFLTYASSWVRKCMLEYLLRNSGAVSLRRGQAEARMFFTLRRERTALEARLAGKPSQVFEELAQRFTTSETRVRQFANRLARGDASLDAARRPDDDRSEGDCLPDGGASPEDQVDRALEAEIVRRACAALEPTERVVVEARLLADEEERESLERVGNRLGLSRERVRQIQLRSARKLRTALAVLAANQGQRDAAASTLPS